MIEQIALERGHKVVCMIDANPHSIIQELKDSKLFSPDEGFESEEFRSADVAIEFSTPGTAKENILRAWAQGVPVVCGTTGWKPEELTIHNAQCTIHNSQFTMHNLQLIIKDNKTLILDENGKTMLVWSSNFSVGVNIFFELNKELARAISHLPSAFSYTPSIKEIHHIHKLDKPSGTAKTLYNDIMSAVSPLNDVMIESIREGEIPGTHEVTWDSEEDTIVITHIAKGRRGFALGAVLAAEKLNVS